MPALWGAHLGRVKELGEEHGRSSDAEASSRSTHCPVPERLFLSVGKLGSVEFRHEPGGAAIPAPDEAKVHFPYGRQRGGDDVGAGH